MDKTTKPVRREIKGSVRREMKEAIASMDKARTKLRPDVSDADSMQGEHIKFRLQSKRARGAALPKKEDE